MTVADYRSLIDETARCRRSLLSAATGDEQRREAMRLKFAAADLRAATCRTANKRDRTRAAFVLADADALLADVRAEFDAQDAALCRMAFGNEWR